MTPLAITFLVIAIVTIWGGFVLALVNLARHPEDEEAMPDELRTEL